MEIFTILRKLVDYRREDSLAIKQRRKRFAFFKELLSLIPKPIRILDVGGTEIFWEKMGFVDEADVEITLLNLSHIDVHHSNFRSVAGDGRNMSEFEDDEFDVVFSNSVIEHVGGYEDQKRMAKEIQRVGKRYFIQTPNFYFPIEPHFLFPFFQFFPLAVKTFMLRHFNLGWHRKINDVQKAVEIAHSIRLLPKSELKQIFPGANIYEERFWGLVKSFILYKGWNITSHNTP